MKRELTLTVNGLAYNLFVEPHLTLVELLRDQLCLIGTKVGCGMGECGACTVIMDGQSVNACLVLAQEADGCRVETIESLAKEDTLHPVQESFINHGAIQCGFCTSGMIMSAKNLLDKNPRPNAEEIRTGMRGNLCRCTGYVKIVEAIEAARDGGKQ